MILRPLQHSSSPRSNATTPPSPAYEVFLAHQEQVRAPYLPIPQSSHAHLAGELAGALLPEVFGALPAEVIEAIRQHDSGWIGSDMEQLQKTEDGGEVRSFPALSAEEAVPAWEATVRLAETASPLIGVLVNRHFCLLSDDDNPLHQQFRERAGSRRLRVERALGCGAEDLDRWTAALGMCDLLSLYLCSGSDKPAEFPFSHPADARSRERVQKTVLTWESGRARCTVPLFRPGTRVEQAVPAVRSLDAAAMLSWEFA
jgi:uncharacterized protein DUF3891